MASLAVSCSREGGIAVLTLKKEPVNSMDMKFWEVNQRAREGVRKVLAQCASMIFCNLSNFNYTVGSSGYV